jgi:RNA-binding protein
MSAPEEGLSGARCKHLRKLGRELQPLARLGKAGVDETLVRELDTLLEERELVKVRFGAFKDQRKEMAALLAEKTGAALVDVVGHVAVYYRRAAEASRQIVTGQLRSIQ